MSAPYQVTVTVPRWLATLALWVIIFAAGCTVGGGRFSLPAIHWPAPTPSKPAGPDWGPVNPPPAPTPTPLSLPAPLEWRSLPSAPGWEGYGRDVDGHFLIETWRLAPQPVQAATPPQPVYQYPAPVIYRGSY